MRRGLTTVIVVTALVFLAACNGDAGGSSAEQQRHEVCKELVANQLKASTLVDQAHAAAQQDAHLTAFAEALKTWAQSDGSETPGENRTIITTCRSEIKASEPPST